MNVSHLLRKKLLEKIKGKKISLVKQGHGTFLTLYFGNIINIKSFTGADVERGELEFWIYICEWKLSKGRKDIFSSEDIDRFDNLKISDKLEGEIIEDLKIVEEVVKITLSNLFEFSLSPVIGEQDEDDDYFIFTDSDSSTISFNLESGLYYEK